MRKWIIGTAVVFAVALLGAGGTLSFAWRVLNSPMPMDERVWLEVPSGTPLWRVSDDLAERGLLRHPHFFRWYATFTGDATRIHAGEYSLAPGLTPRGLLDKLVRRQVYL